MPSMSEQQKIAAALRSEKNSAQQLGLVGAGMKAGVDADNARNALLEKIAAQNKVVLPSIAMFADSDLRDSEKDIEALSYKLKVIMIEAAAEADLEAAKRKVEELSKELGQRGRAISNIATLFAMISITTLDAAWKATFATNLAAVAVRKAGDEALAESISLSRTKATLFSDNGKSARTEKLVDDSSIIDNRKAREP